MLFWLATALSLMGLFGMGDIIITAWPHHNTPITVQAEQVQAP